MSFKTLFAGAILASSLTAGELLTIVTSPDAQTQLMAMVLSSQAQKQGANVQILLCGPAGDLALKGSKETILKPMDTSPQKLMAGLIKNGATAQVCPLFLPNAGKTPADLIEGLTVAKPPVVAEKMMMSDTKILSY